MTDSQIFELSQTKNLMMIMMKFMWFQDTLKEELFQMTRNHLSIKKVKPDLKVKKKLDSFLAIQIKLANNYDWKTCDWKFGVTKQTSFKCDQQLITGQYDQTSFFIKTCFK